MSPWSSESLPQSRATSQLDSGWPDIRRKITAELRFADVRQRRFVDADPRVEEKR